MEGVVEVEVLEDEAGDSVVEAEDAGAGGGAGVGGGGPGGEGVGGV